MSSSNNQESDKKKEEENIQSPAQNSSFVEKVADFLNNAFYCNQEKLKNGDCGIDANGDIFPRK